MGKDKDKEREKHRHKDKGKKEKHKKHKKRSGKEKERRHHRSGGGSGSDSSTSSGSSGGGAAARRRGAALAQLERDRAAVRAARALLGAHPGAARDLRQLLWSLDNGKSVSVAGVPDAALRAALEELLSHLGLKSAKGQLFLPSGAPTTLSVVGFVFDEPIQPAPASAPEPAAAAPQPAGPAAAPAPDAAAEAAVAGAAAAPRAGEDGHISSGSSSDEDEGGGGGVRRADIGPAMPPGMHAAAAAAADSGDEAGADGGAAAPVGPAPPPAAASGGSGDEGGAAAEGPRPAASPGPEGVEEDGASPGGREQASGGEREEQQAAAAAPRRRVVGPAMPAPEILAAAATYKAEVEAGAGWDAVIGGGDDDDDDPLVGPPPPAYVEADAAAPADARSAEVVRVLRVLREAAAGKGGGGAAAAAAAPAAPAEADPYDILGVSHAAAAGEVRKVYWRLSLLVHPDKCAHAGAAEAFQAVSQAAATLQDAAARKKVDDSREDARLRRIALDVAAEHERRRQWAALRGEKLPPELEAAAAAAAAAVAAPLARETWMTDLPPELDHLAGAAAEGPRQFSRFGIKKRGDTSGWTDTPEQAALRAAGMLPQPPGAPLAIAAGPAGRLSGAEIAAPAGVVAAVKEYNEKHRQKSLLEQHMERQQQTDKERRKEKRAKEKEREREKEKEREKEEEERGRDKKAGKKDKDKEKAKGEKRPAAGPPEEDWVGKHPWRPFDRDKDLEIKSKPKTGAAMFKAAGGLSSRFSSGGR